MTTLTDPLLGTVLSGRYRVESPVARGGMAMVYRATDLRLDREVAVKVMHQHLLADDGFVERFEREAINAAKLSHPNLVAVHDQGRDGDAVYLVMEYLESVTLRKELKHRGKLTPRQAIVVLDSILAALEAVHGAGMIHRDLKPDNVLLGTDGQIKLADFGLARAVSTATTTKTLIGTVGYVAPELVTRQGADARTDLYTLGIMFYEMLTGAQPYTDEVPIQVAYRHVHDSVPAPSEAVAGLSPLLDAIVLWATSRDPDDRPAEATELRIALGEARAELTAAELDLGGEDAAGSRDPHTPVLTATVVVSADSGEVPKEKRSRTDEIPYLTDDVQLSAAEADAADSATAPERTPAVASTGTGQHRPPAGRGGTCGAGAAGAGTSSDTSGRPLVRLRKLHTSAPAGPRQRRNRVLAGLVAAVLVVVLIGWTVIGGGEDPREVPVETAGKDAQDVITLVTEAGLRTQTEEAFDATVPAGKVIGTEPAGGTELDPDALVTIIVSKGEQLFGTPDVAGKTLDEARAAIEDAGLTVGEVSRKYHGSVKDGRVITQSVSAGDEVSAGTTVDLEVSKGVAPLVVPKVEGWTYDAAFGKLARMGFLISKEEVYDDSVAKGRVVSQWPRTGTEKRPGDLVILKVSKGKKPAEEKKSEDEPEEKQD